MDRKEPPDPRNVTAIERRAPAQPMTVQAHPYSTRLQPPGTDPFAGGLPLYDYVRILRKHKWMILTVVAVMVTVVTIFSFRMSPVYQAATRLEINGEIPEMSTLQALYTLMPTDPEFLETQVRILQSDDLAMQTVRYLRLHDQPEFRVQQAGAPGSPFTNSEESQLISRFRSHLSVQLVRSSRLVEIRFESTDPRLAADVANKLADLYIETNFRKKYDSTVQAQEWMASQLRELRDKMEKSHQALITYEREKQIFAINDGQNVTMQKLGEINRELTLAESDRITRESQFQLVKTRRLDDLPAVANNQLFSDLQKRMAALNEELAELRLTFGPNHPKLQRVEQQIAEVRSQMDREMQQVANRIESEYQAALKREQLLRRAFEQQKEEANLMNTRLVEYGVLKREFETNQQLYEGLLQRLKEAGVSAGLRANNIHVVDRARPPLQPVRPRRTLNILLSLVIGLIVGGVLAIFNEYLDNSVKMPEEIEQLINLPALGVIPAVSSIGPNPHYGYALGSGNGGKKTTLIATPSVPSPSELPTVSQPHSVVAEAYRALRTALLLSTSKHPPQIILVTSGQPREGKTTTAVNLAVTLAQRGDRVVLIDSDLRRPRIHRSLGVSNEVGLSSYLAGSTTIDELPVPVSSVSRLFVIPSGPTPPNPAELLSSEPMEALLRELRRQFDFIVMDSPPIITVADGMILAAHADGVIVVAHGGVTTRESLRQTHKQLTSVNAHTVGVLLNNVDIRSADYQHYYTYYYGDYYRHMLEGYSYGFDRESHEEKPSKAGRRVAT